MTSVNCQNCLTFFLTSQQYYGHLNVCRKVKINSFEIVCISRKKKENEVVRIENDCVGYCDDVPIDKTCKLFQDALIVSLQEKRKDLPKIKDSLRNFVTPNRRIFNTIIKYTAKRHQLSEEGNTDMIIMIKRISRINGSEIPLPSR